MTASIAVLGNKRRVDFSRPMDISIPLREGKENVTAWNAPPPRMEAVVSGSVNSRILTFSPHGNGTHTECLGHLGGETLTIHRCLTRFFFTARLISVKPVLASGATPGETDRIITGRQLAPALQGDGLEALIIRTLPNERRKLSFNYTGTNPAYLEAEAAALIAASGIEHLLVDLPSLDREKDGGALAAHKQFWKYPAAPRVNATITELIFVPEEIPDGDYLLHLGIISLESDASPSKPVLY